jgi:hypothetical protein
MPKKTTTKNSEGNFEPFNINDLPWEQWPGSDRFKRLGRYGGATHVGTGIDEIGPGQYSNEFHYHLMEEEHIFILKGSATFVPRQQFLHSKGRRLLLFPSRPARGSSSVQSHRRGLHLHHDRRKQTGRSLLLPEDRQSKNQINRRRFEGTGELNCRSSALHAQWCQLVVIRIKCPSRQRKSRARN